MEVIELRSMYYIYIAPEGFWNLKNLSFTQNTVSKNTVSKYCLIR